MPTPRRYLDSTIPSDNTAQIGRQQRNKGEAYVNNFYYDALKRVKRGSRSPYDKGIVNARDPNSLYSKIRRSSGRLETTSPEFDLMTMLPARYLANAYVNTLAKAHTRLANEVIVPALKTAGNKAAPTLINTGYNIAKSRPLQNITKRAIETAMRTGPASDGLDMVRRQIKGFRKGYEGGNKRLFDIGKYILTGRTGGKPKGWYNSFAPIINGDIKYYGGIQPKDLSKRTMLDVVKKGTGYDYIDAYLYRRPVDPQFGLKRVAPDKDFEGFASYINKNYRNKKLDIPVYEASVPKGYVRAEEPILEPRTSYYDSSISTNGDFIVDTGGHKFLSGNKQWKESDIWKFKSDEYLNRYFKNSERAMPKLYRHLLKRGLDLVDDLGTPIVTKTPWYTREIYVPDYTTNFEPIHDLPFKYGGTIHIKKKNRGKFTATKKRTGKTTEELTHSKNPLTRKRAIFAQNARKWNHG